MCPMAKIKTVRVKSTACDDFRGITISPLISKVFEHCVLDRFQSCFLSCDVQFRFKKDTLSVEMSYTYTRFVQLLIR